MILQRQVSAWLLTGIDHCLPKLLSVIKCTLKMKSLELLIIRSKVLKKSSSLLKEVPPHVSTVAAGNEFLTQQCLFLLLICFIVVAKI